MAYLNDEERQEFANELAAYSYRKARKAIRKADTDANLKTFRNGVRQEIHTMYELPNLGVRVILVETGKATPMRDSHLVKKEYFYTEARVEPWTPPQSS